MRDAYCIKLFTFQNVCKLLKSGQYIDAVLLFPFAAWIAADFSVKIDLEFRLFLIEISFQMIMEFKNNFFQLKAAGVLQKAREGSSFVTIHENQYTIRMLNSLIASAIALLFTSNFVRMDGIGTHLVENNIGMARQTSSDLRWTCITIFAHSELRKKLALKLGFKLKKLV